MPIIRSVVLSTTLALSVLVAAPAQAEAAPNSGVTVITELPARVQLAPGQKVRVRLSTNVTTGYSWFADGGCCTKSGKPVVRVPKAGKYQASDNPAGLVGAPGQTTWTITAVRPGRTTVNFITRPPGVENTMQDETVGTLRITVRR